MTLETEQDLVDLVNERTSESVRLDFKASDSLQRTDKKKADLGKDTAAFATAEGGTLVYGVMEDPETHEADRLDAGSDPAVISKEWIEQVIDGNVSPRIEGIRITAIELKTTSPGRNAFVVQVPASDRAPHMASDHRYYTRQNFQSVPMEDYQVRDVFFRRRAPRLELLPLVTKPGEHYTLKFRLRNSGRVAAEHLYLEVEFERSRISPSSWTPLDHPPIVFHRKLAGRSTDVLCYIQTNAPAGRNEPEYKRLPTLIYPGMEVDLQELSIPIQTTADPAAVVVARLHAKDMPTIVQPMPIASLLSGT